MTESSRSKLAPAQVIFGILALTSLWEAIDHLYQGEKLDAAERFVFAMVASLIAVFRAEWKPWLIWLASGLLITQVALLIVEAVS